MTSQDRIELTAHRAFRNPARAKESARWYHESGIFCRDLSAGLPFTPEQTTAFVAALSPLNGWEDQLRFSRPSLESAARIIDTGETRVEIVARTIVGPGLGENRKKAARVLLGEPVSSVLSGDKVKAFYANLSGDESRVTIDRHALAIAFGEGIEVTAKRYRDAQTAFQCVAPLFNVTPAGLQALTWCFWRESKAGRPW